VVLALDTYLDISKDWRDKKTQLLLSFLKPHKEVASSTVSRWIKTVLGLTGIRELGNFSGHSTRSASTSKVANLGLSLQEILDRGCWNRKSTWQRFYNKEIISKGETFQTTLLSKADKDK